MRATTAAWAPANAATNRGALHADLGVPPGQHQHQQESREQEAEAGQEASDPASGQHAEVDAQLLGFGARKDLVHRQRAVESLGADPLLVVHQFPSQHRDLRDRSAPRQAAKAEETQDKLPEAERRNPGISGFGSHWLSVPAQGRGRRGSATSAGDRAVDNFGLLHRSRGQPPCVLSPPAGMLLVSRRGSWPTGDHINGRRGSFGTLLCPESYRRSSSRATIASIAAPRRLVGEQRLAGRLPR